MQDIFGDDVICCIPLSECATFYIDPELYQDIFDMIGKTKKIKNYFPVNIEFYSEPFLIKS